MTFDERVKFLRKLPKFMVEPEVEIRAIAYAVREVYKVNEDDCVIGTTENGYLTIAQTDIEKILREYPDLAPKFK